MILLPKNSQYSSKLKTKGKSAPGKQNMKNSFHQPKSLTYQDKGLRD